MHGINFINCNLMCFPSFVFFLLSGNGKLHSSIFIYTNFDLTVELIGITSLIIVVIYPSISIIIQTLFLENNIFSVLIFLCHIKENNIYIYIKFQYLYIKYNIIYIPYHNNIQYCNHNTFLMFPRKQNRFVIKLILLHVLLDLLY